MWVFIYINICRYLYIEFIYPSTLPFPFSFSVSDQHRRIARICIIDLYSILSVPVPCTSSIPWVFRKKKHENTKYETSNVVEKESCFHNSPAYITSQHPPTIDTAHKIYSVQNYAWSFNTVSDCPGIIVVHSIFSCIVNDITIQFVTWAVPWMAVHVHRSATVMNAGGAAVM